MNISKIATLASKYKKINRKQAFNTVLELINGKEMDELRLSELYSFFTPAIPAKPKTPLQWVSKAIAKGDVRYYLNEMYSDGETMCATTGHFLFTAPTNKSEGFYNAQGVAIELNGKFPEFETIIESAEFTNCMDLTGLEVDTIHGGKTEVYKLPDGGYVQRAFLDKALSFGGDYEAGKKDMESPLIINFSDSRRALIMPVRK